MACETFKHFNFKPQTLDIIDRANEIIADYARQGFALTLRQLYYQFIARGVLVGGEPLPNTEKSYDKLGGVINDARLAGLIDWEAIEDRTRGMKKNWHVNSPKHAIEIVTASYGINMWANQPMRCEVWVEKEALVGVVEGVCSELDVPYLACRGYLSQSEQWRSYRRILAHHENSGQETIVFHLGDHDPSGIDMTRDNNDRLNLFLSKAESEGAVTVRRLALNMDQIERYSPPPNPAKTTDARFAGYLARFGEHSWELDALEPTVIRDLIRQNVLTVRDDDLWEERQAELADDIAKLKKLAAKL